MTLTNWIVKTSIIPIMSNTIICAYVPGKDIPCRGWSFSVGVFNKLIGIENLFQDHGVFYIARFFDNGHEEIVKKIDSLFSGEIYYNENMEPMLDYTNRGCAVKTEKIEDKKIEITIEKFVKSGYNWVTVKDIKGILSEKDLPQPYLDSRNHIKMCGNSVRNNEDYSILTIGMPIPKESFEDVLRRIEIAKMELRRIKEKIERETKGWNGLETIKI